LPNTAIAPNPAAERRQYRDPTGRSSPPITVHVHHVFVHNNVKVI
jgi:hypothetical protein